MGGKVRVRVKKRSIIIKFISNRAILGTKLNDNSSSRGHTVSMRMYQIDCELKGYDDNLTVAASSDKAGLK